MSRGFVKLLTMMEANPKMAKGRETDYYAAIMHLAPAMSSGFQVCASASQGCISSCLNTAGRGRSSKIQDTRIARTRYFMQHRAEFLSLLRGEIDALVKRCKRLGKLPALRLNGTSDIVWEKVAPQLFTDYPQIQFYDYTKHAKRCMKSYQLPPNYHLTFSRSETNHADCRRVARSGAVNIAVVFRTSDYPPTYLGRPVYDMDGHDFRFLDPPGVGGLYAKGPAKKDNSGFVVDA